MLAAATASWIATFTPTPPIGDIAWAASPMHRKARPPPLLQPVDGDGQQFDVIPILQLGDAVLQDGASRNNRNGSCRAAGAHCIVAAPCG